MSSVRSTPMSLRDWALLVFLSVLWGGSFFFNAVTVAALPPLTVVFARVAIAAAMLWLVIGVTRTAMPGSRTVWAAFFGMGLLNNAIPFALIVWGQTQLASGVAAILNAATPLFTVLFAHVLTTDEKMSTNRLAGVVLGLVGVAVMIGARHAGTAGLLAPLACLGAAVSYALAGLYGRRFRAMGVAPMATAAGQVTASSLILLPVVLLVDRPWSLPAPGSEVVLALVALGLASTALAYVVYFRLLASAGATNLLLVTLLVPASAILLGVGFLGEVLLPRHLAGMALIALGLAAIDGRLPRAALRVADARRRDSLGAGAGRVEGEKVP